MLGTGTSKQKIGETEAKVEAGGVRGIDDENDVNTILKSAFFFNTHR